jgi:hypothetical protein
MFCHFSADDLDNGWFSPIPTEPLRHPANTSIIGGVDAIAERKKPSMV